MSNSVSVLFSTGTCIHHLFEAQVQRTPTATACIHKERRISYTELNSRANQLARYLQSLGVAPEVAVGIFMERSIEMVVAVIGVLKAGGAYVPLDPKYPAARLGYLIQNSGLKLILTSAQTKNVADLACDNRRIPLLTVDAQWEEAQSNTDNCVSNADPQNLAYIIYTSGSTGKPKGVGIAHESSVMFLKWVGKTFTPADLKGVLASTSLCFDLSIFEIFAPICYGGYFVLVENALALATLPNASDVHLLNSVPSVTSELLESGGIPSSVEIVNLAGERFSQALLRRLDRLKSISRILNLYGPTECTTYSTCAEIVAHEDQKPSIGRPISNTTAYVLNEFLLPADLLVEGELYLSGAGVARGYINHPELTAERFLPDPFSTEKDQRMYRTGDIVRRLPSGDLEFVGRKDHQIKLRGYRIELGEIEMALNSHEQVRDSVVLLRTGARGEQHLVAYVVLSANCDPAELRSFLRSRLPDFMVPASYVVLQKLPLTANGKLDREALPLPADSEYDMPFVAPRTAEESEIAKIFAEVLQLPTISVTDDFFQLGGDSLSAFRIISRLRDAFQLQLDRQTLFDTTTIAGLAEKISNTRYFPLSVSAKGLHAGLRTSRSPLSFTQQRLFFLEKLQTGKPLYNVSASIHLKGALDHSVLNRSLNEIVKRHESLRTCFPIHDGLPFQQIQPAAEVPLPLIDLRLLDQGTQAKEVQCIASQQLNRFFDLTIGPLLRAQLLCLNEDEHILLLITHHIVFDDWSLDVLLRELQTIYEASAAGMPSLLPDLPIQYADFAVWQHRRMCGERLEAQLSYWRKQLSNPPPNLRLPTRNPHLSIPSQQGTQETFPIDSLLCDSIRKLIRSQRVTLFMTLLAAFNALLYTYTLQDDLVVGTVSAGRDEPLTEPLIGCFINTLILRTLMSGNPTFIELLTRVRMVALEAYENQDAPFEKVAAELRRARAAKDAPILQVAFGVRNTRSFAPAKSLAGLSFSAFEVATETARFDLTVWIEECQNGLRASWTYAMKLFSADTIRQMHQRYIKLLNEIVCDPTIRLSELLKECAETVDTPQMTRQLPTSFVRKERRAVILSRP